MQWFANWRKQKPGLAAPDKLDQVLAAVGTDPGCCREENQDSAAFFDSHGNRGSLVLVADGMGGHRAGRVASQIAVEVIGRRYSASRRPAPEALREAIEAANREIFQRSQTDSATEGMGCTVVAMAIEESAAHVAHVGDSRLYLVRAGAIFQMTEDHSVITELLRSGSISREDARRHSQRNVISRALGSKAAVEIDLAAAFPLRRGDRFLLCTDGLTDLVDRSELLQVIGKFQPAEAVERLIELAKIRGGHDNITAIVAWVGDQGPSGVPPTREASISMEGVSR